MLSKSSHFVYLNFRQRSKKSHTLHTIRDNMLFQTYCEIKTNAFFNGQNEDSHQTLCLSDSLLSAFIWISLKHVVAIWLYIILCIISNKKFKTFSTRIVLISNKKIFKSSWFNLENHHFLKFKWATWELPLILLFFILFLQIPNQNTKVSSEKVSHERIFTGQSKLIG